jgi:hypothetical protein
MGFEGKWIQLEDIMLSEVSQAQKDKSYFSVTCRRQIQKINMSQKQARSYTNSYVEHVCNTGTILWNSEKEGRKRE